MQSMRRATLLSGAPEVDEEEEEVDDDEDDELAPDDDVAPEDDDDEELEAPSPSNLSKEGNRHAAPAMAEPTMTKAPPAMTATLPTSFTSMTYRQR